LIGGDTDTLGAVAVAWLEHDLVAKFPFDRWLIELHKTDEPNRLRATLAEHSFQVSKDALVLRTNGTLDL